jgi:hypothetical protein
MAAPTSVHYSHLLRVLRYLRGTISRRLFFPRSSSLQLQTYSDATWASDPEDRKSLCLLCLSWWLSHCLEDQEAGCSLSFEC